MARLLFFAPVLGIIAVALYFLFLKSPPPLPDLPLDEWWGPETLKGKQNDRVKPFRIKFDTMMLQDLKQYFKVTRSPFTPPLEGINFEYGFNSNVIDGWLKYWSEEYDFVEREKFLNQYKGYKTYIQGLGIHFLHVKPEVPKGVEVVPVLLLHGWPGSIREFYEAIPFLTAVDKNRDYALELIIPSLPGYGFSDAAVRPGLGAPEVAVVLRNLMHRLGYKQFYIQGGDWGSIIGSDIATLFPNEVMGYHTNMPTSKSTTATLLEILGSIYPPLIVDQSVAERMYPLEKRFSFLLEESGYLHIQATKPDTIGVALSDSPAGLLAYILEKFSTGTNRDLRSNPTGGLTDHFTKEQLIDNLMFYWAPNSITTSMRLYAESFNKRTFGYNLDIIPTPVPTWCIQSKYEITYQPPLILRLKYPNLLNATILDDGGHFLALQMPKTFSEDVVKAIGEFRQWHQIKKKTEL